MNYGVELDITGDAFTIQVFKQYKSLNYISDFVKKWGKYLRRQFNQELNSSVRIKRIYEFD